MRISKKISNIIWICLCAVIAFSCLGNQSVYADSSTAGAVEIPAHFDYGSNGLNPSRTYQLIMTPEDGAPMPEDAVDNVSAISVSQSKGQDYAFRIPYSRYSSVGEYWYTIVLKDSGDKELGTWRAHVMLQNVDKGLAISVTLRKNTEAGKTDKVDKITAVDSDQPVPSTTVTPGTGTTVTPGPGTGSQTGTTTVPSSAASAQKSSTNAKTGDSSNTRLWIITLSVSTALLLLFLSYLAGKQRKQKISKE